MSTSTIEAGTILVSDLPPVTTPIRGLFDGVRTRVAEARDRRAFAKALGHAGPSELSDLIAASRRS